MTVRGQIIVVALLALAGAAHAQTGQHADYKLAIDKDGGVIAYLPDATYTPGKARTKDPKKGLLGNDRAVSKDNARDETAGVQGICGQENQRRVL